MLGEYLRARRELVDPADAGLRAMGVRRTPGLRREEVATLAGISADYYLRLEQGRDRNPSPQVLEALARVFGLDATATQYLLSLSAARPTARKRPRREVVPVGIRQLWARHDVKPLAGAPIRMRHPQVGMLELGREKLAIGDSGGQLLVIYHAEPGSDSARSLALLGSLTATETEEPAKQGIGTTG